LGVATIVVTPFFVWFIQYFDDDHRFETLEFCFAARFDREHDHPISWLETFPHLKIASGGSIEADFLTTTG
jgi:hypothetical protein